MTKTVVEDNAHPKILNILKTGERDYSSFRDEQYITKSKKLTAKISKTKPALFKSPSEGNGKTQQSSEEISCKDIAVAQRKMDIAAKRGMKIE